jgi:Flp pilus assembly protein TadG
MRRPDRSRRSDAGATAIEFALVAPVVLLLIFAALYGAFYYFYVAAASHVARSVARDASIPEHRVYPSAADEMTVAKQAAGAMLPAPTSVSVVPVTTVHEGNAVTVTVTYDLPALMQVGRALPFLPRPGGVITRTVTVRYE